MNMTTVVLIVANSTFSVSPDAMQAMRDQASRPLEIINVAEMQDHRTEALEQVLQSLDDNVLTLDAMPDPGIYQEPDEEEAEAEELKVDCRRTSTILETLKNISPREQEASSYG
jgi:hypothetical protein